MMKMWMGVGPALRSRSLLPELARDLRRLAVPKLPRHSMDLQVLLIEAFLLEVFFFVVPFAVDTCAMFYFAEFSTTVIGTLSTYVAGLVITLALLLLLFIMLVVCEQLVLGKWLLRIASKVMVLLKGTRK